DEPVLLATLDGQRGQSAFGEATLFTVIPGKYRVTVRLSLDRPERWTAQRLQCSVVQDGLPGAQRERAVIAISPARFPADGSPVTLAAAFTVPEGNLEGGGKQVRCFVSWADRGTLTVLRHHGVTVERLTDSLVIEETRNDKLLYAPGERGVARATIRNLAKEAVAGTVRFTLERELADRIPLPPVEVTVEAGESRAVEVPFTAPEEEYGYRLGAVVRAAGGEDAGEDFFNVADNLWKVCIGGQDMLSQSALVSKERITADIERARMQYCNWLEKFFWAPDDWGDMTPEPGATWLSGQTGRYENFDNLRHCIAEMRKRGMKAITYGKAMAYGTVAFELNRRRPDWFTLDAVGRPIGMWNDVSALDRWRDYDVLADLRDKTYHKGYAVPRIYPDHRRDDVLEYAINEVIGSAQLLGWDGVRFDSSGFRAYYIDGTKDGRDEVNTYAMKRLKERLWGWNPDFLIGHNTRVPAYLTKDGRAYPLSPTDPAGHEYRETLAGGVIYMNESIREQPMKNGSVAYTSWQRYAADEARAVRTARGFGGHIFYSYGVGPFSAGKLGRAHDVYKFVIGTMIGAHEYAGAHLAVDGSEHWGKFLTRWSGFLWDTRLRPLGAGEQALAVEAKTPLWWRDFANSRVVSPTRRFVIVHLLNPPPTDEIEKTGDALPPPVTDARVRFIVPRGQTLARAYVIAPGYPDRAEELPITRGRGGASVAVPAFPVWAMVVWELTGNYTVPAAPPKFSEPMTADEERERQAWIAKTVRITVADDLLNPTPHAPDAAPRDWGTPTVQAPADLRPGGEPGMDILVIRGLHHEAYRIPAALPATARVTACTAAQVPKTHADLYQYDIIVLAGIGAEAWDVNGLGALADFVRAGGRLVVLGGQATLGQGFFRGSPLEAVLPVAVRPARDIYQAPHPLALGEKPNHPFPDTPVLKYFHAVHPRPEARATLWGGDLPLVHDWTVGAGRARVFVGTPLGEGKPGESAFYLEWPGWPALLGKIILGD
ncbi:MAG TPA: hypothetical protein PK794_05815, partial [Armatimonadota bacterium]|nr:hypothetical protein [Armatimonadota bacterium]